MKNIFIFSPYWSTLGGGEKYVLTVAHILSNLNDVHVTLLTTDKNVDKQILENFCNLNLSKVEYRFINNFRETKGLINDKDIFICLSNVHIFKTNASVHIQLLQIPFKRMNIVTLFNKIFKFKFEEVIKDLFRQNLLSFAKKKANIIVTNSLFVHNILKNNYSIHSEVLFPPIQNFSSEEFQKKNIILSVGRFFYGYYNNKRYDILTEAFRDLYNQGVIDWEYHIIGNVADDSATRKMIVDLQNKNKSYPVFFHFNTPYGSLKKYYNEASIFWHAAGYGVDENKYPENVEHFGMTTVEAMSAGCVPIVHNSGGQREIIINGQNGFLWRRKEELIEFTIRTIKNIPNLMNLQQKARERFLEYDISKFNNKLLEIMIPVIR